LSLYLTLLIHYTGNITAAGWQIHLFPFSIIYSFWLIIFFIAGLYELSLARNTINFYSTLLQTLIIGAGVAIAFFYFLPFFNIAPKTNLFINLGVFAVLFSLWRQFFNYVIKASTLINNVLIINKNQKDDESKQIIEIIQNNPQYGYRVVSQIRPKEIQTPFDLLETATQKNIKTIVTAIDPHQDAKIVRSLYQCLPLKIHFSDLPTFYEKILGKVPLSSIGEMWFLENLTESQKNFYEAGKRAADIISALILGIISLPFYPFIALVIKFDSDGPVFFTQRRMGQDGQIFKLIKFRTMTEDKDKSKARWATEESHRITKVGKFLRKSRLDELPQLWNILAGQMSFIGPRPERIEFIQQLEQEIPYYQIRHLVKPGLTGWAQVNFRYGASVQDSIEKLQYELYYIKHRSLVLDVSIILRTIKIVLKAMGR
jgi:exopolysaccharide biosynthesis polyprenyl glycosylphosphotransferase